MLKKLYVYMEQNTYRKQYTYFYNLKIWKYEEIFQLVVSEMQRILSEQVELSNFME
jgi:hypothetical protein